MQVRHLQHHEAPHLMQLAPRRRGAHASLFPVSDPRPERQSMASAAAGDPLASQGGAMSAQYVEPAPGSALPPSRWYYRSADVAISNLYVHTYHDRYALGELADLGMVKGPAHPAVLISSVIAVVQAPIVVPIAAIVHSPTAILLAAVLLVVPVEFGRVSRAIRRAVEALR